MQFVFHFLGNFQITL